MIKKRKDLKEIIIVALILLVGAGLTAMSFCVYYLVRPRKPWVLSVICTVDFLYSIFTSCAFVKLADTGKWLLKGFLFSFGYFVLFIVVAILFMLFAIAVDFIKNNFLVILFYAFFTSPSMFIIGTVLLLGLSYS